MSKSDLQKRTALVRRSDQRPRTQEDGAGEPAVHRSGVFELDEQRPPSDAGNPEEAFRFLVAFVRELIRNSPSGDALLLAAYAASAEANITREQAQTFIEWILAAKDSSPWPEGFF